MEALTNRRETDQRVQKIIRKNLTFISGKLSPRGVIEYLFEKEVLTRENYDQLQIDLGRFTESRVNRILFLDILFRKEKYWINTIKAIRTCEPQSSVADLIESVLPDSDKRKLERWYTHHGFKTQDEESHCNSDHPDFPNGNLRARSIRHGRHRRNTQSDYSSDATSMDSGEHDGNSEIQRPNISSLGFQPANGPDSVPETSSEEPSVDLGQPRATRQPSTSPPQGLQASDDDLYSLLTDGTKFQTIPKQVLELDKEVGIKQPFQGSVSSQTSQETPEDETECKAVRQDIRESNSLEKDQGQSFNGDSQLNEKPNQKCEKEFTQKAERIILTQRLKENQIAENNKAQSPHRPGYADTREAETGSPESNTSDSNNLHVSEDETTKLDDTEMANRNIRDTDTDDSQKIINIGVSEESDSSVNMGGMKVTPHDTKKAEPVRIQQLFTQTARTSKLGKEDLLNSVNGKSIKDEDEDVDEDGDNDGYMITMKSEEGFEHQTILKHVEEPETEETFLKQFVQGTVSALISGGTPEDETECQDVRREEQGCEEVPKLSKTGHAKASQIPQVEHSSVSQEASAPLGVDQSSCPRQAASSRDAEQSHGDAEQSHGDAEDPLPAANSGFVSVVRTVFKSAVKFFEYYSFVTGDNTLQRWHS